MKSLVQSLAKVGKKPPFSIKDGFQTQPNSLREILRILNLPNPKLETLQYKKIHEFSENDAQGLTYGYNNIWFLSSQYKIFKYSIQGNDLFTPTKLRRLKKVRLSDLIGATNLKQEYDHIGDIDYFGGLIFAPIRHYELVTVGPFRDSKSKPPHILLALSKNLEVVGYCFLSMETGDSWCAINPWNRLLYMPNTSDTTSLLTYDVSVFYKVLHDDRHTWGKNVSIRLHNKGFQLKKEDGSPTEVTNIQGAVFSQNGRLYIPRYNGDGPWYNYLHVYNALTGIRLSVSPEYDFPGGLDEIEGISIHPSGVIYVAVAINDILSTDEFEIYAFKYSNSTEPV